MFATVFGEGFCNTGIQKFGGFSRTIV